jgi:glycosyltransferase involved in cell wall biosynthesis
MIDALRADAPEARWVIVGDGALHAEVAAEIAARGLGDTVRLTGVLPRSDALARLSACDVVVSPHVPNPDGSPFFGSPIKLFEYMGLAKAIVASDLGQIADVIDDGRTGVLCPPGDAAAAAAAVARLLADGELRSRLGAAALDEAAERHSWRAHSRRMLDALARVP